MLKMRWVTSAQTYSYCAPISHVICAAPLIGWACGLSIFWTADLQKTSLPETVFVLAVNIQTWPFLFFFWLGVSMTFSTYEARQLRKSRLSALPHFLTFSNQRLPLGDVSELTTSAISSTRRLFSLWSLTYSTFDLKLCCRFCRLLNHRIRHFQVIPDVSEIILFYKRLPLISSVAIKLFFSVTFAIVKLI